VAAVAGGLRLRVFLVDHVLSTERRNSSKAMTTIHHNPSPTNIRCYRVCGEESRTVSVELEGFHRTGLIDQLATCGPVVL
jgi:hypothetical protein